MKTSVLRLCSAFLLMGIALAVSLGIMAGAVGSLEESPQEPDYVWLYLPFVAEPREEIWLYASEGDLLDRLITDASGRASSGLLPPGEYYAATLDGCTVFRLENNLQVLVTGGCGSFEDGVLYLKEIQR